MAQWDPDFYKTGYEGFESPATFVGSEALEQYRALLLQKSLQQVAFIARRLGTRRLRVIEFCSGNGRLLMALAQAGLLEHGVGVEISESRTTFARQWARDLDLSQLELVPADALTFRGFAPGSFDLAVCITGAFNYLYPIRPSAPLELARQMAEAVGPYGAAVLEVYQLTQHRLQMLKLAGETLRTWQPLPRADRFAYYLDEFTYLRSLRILKHEKTFIGREGQIDAGRIEVMKYYSLAELTSLLRDAGFVTIDVFGDFAECAYRSNTSNAQVVWASCP